MERYCLHLYFAHFFPANLGKLQLVLLDLLRAGQFPETLHLVDLGVGPGTTFLAVLDFVLALGAMADLLGMPLPLRHVTLAGYDRSPACLAYAGDVVKAFGEVLTVYGDGMPGPGGSALVSLGTCRGRAGRREVAPGRHRRCRGSRISRTESHRAVVCPARPPRSGRRVSLRRPAEAEGLLLAQRPDVAFAVIPIGSANDYAHSLELGDDWWRRPDPAIAARQVDVGQVCSGSRSRFFCNGLGLGFNGFVTLEAQRIRFVRGLPLYALALLRALFYRFATPAMTVQLDKEPPCHGPTLALSAALGRREGNFVVAPDALLDDGAFDFVHAGALRRRSLLGFLPGLVTGNLPSHPAVKRGRCRSIRVQSQTPLIVHVDGEFFCLPGDGVHELEVDLLPGALRVLGRLSRGTGPG